MLPPPPLFQIIFSVQCDCHEHTQKFCLEGLTLRPYIIFCCCENHVKMSESTSSKVTSKIKSNWKRKKYLYIHKCLYIFRYSSVLVISWIRLNLKSSKTFDINVFTKCFLNFTLGGLPCGGGCCCYTLCPLTSPTRKKVTPGQWGSTIPHLQTLFCQQKLCKQCTETVGEWAGFCTQADRKWLVTVVR